MKRDDPLPTMECLDFKRGFFGSECSVKITKSSKCPKVVVIPDEFEGYPVTTIEPSGFEDCYNLEAIFIPESIKEIRSSAFQNCSSLKHITIPNSVETLGSGVFKKCRKLKSIDLPQKLQKIPDNTFDGCENLVEIELPQKIREIGVSAFSDCKSLKELEFSPSCPFLQQIGNGAFQNCVNLKLITFPQSITDIGSDTFRNCVSLMSLDLSDSVRHISTNAFNGCSNLVQLILSTHINTVYSNAFKGCDSLKRIRLVGGSKIRSYTEVNLSSVVSQAYCVIDDDDNENSTDELFGLPVLQESQEYELLEEGGFIKENGQVDLSEFVITRNDTNQTTVEKTEAEEKPIETPDSEIQESIITTKHLMVEVLSLSNDPNKSDLIQIAAHVADPDGIKDQITICIKPDQYEDYQKSALSKTIIDGLTENGVSQEEAYAQFKEFLEKNSKDGKLTLFSYHAKETWDQLNNWFVFNHDPFLKTYFKPIQIDFCSLLLGLYPTFFQFGSMDLEPIWKFCAENKIVNSEGIEFVDDYKELANSRLFKLLRIWVVLLIPTITKASEK